MAHTTREELLVDITTWTQGDLNHCRVEDIIQGEDSFGLRMNLLHLEAIGMIQIARGTLERGVTNFSNKDYIHVTPLGVLSALRYSEEVEKAAETSRAITELMNRVNQQSHTTQIIDEPAPAVTQRPGNPSANTAFNDWLDSL